MSYERVGLFNAVVLQPVLIVGLIHGGVVFLVQRILKPWFKTVGDTGDFIKDGYNPVGEPFDVEAGRSEAHSKVSDYSNVSVQGLLTSALQTQPAELSSWVSRPYTNTSIKKVNRGYLKTGLRKIGSPDVAGAVFSLSCTFSVGLWILLLWECIGTQTSTVATTRALLWNFEICGILCCAYGLLPMVVCCSLGERIWKSRTVKNWYIRCFLSILVSALVVTWTHGVPFCLGKFYLKLQYTQWGLMPLASRLGILGVIGVSVLSGVGSIELPYQQLLVVSVSLKDMEVLREELYVTRNMLRAAETEATRFLLRGPRTVRKSVGLWGRLLTQFKSEDCVNSEAENLKHRIRTLKLLEENQEANMLTCEIEWKKKVQANSWQGGLFRWVSWLCVPLCMFRIASAGWYWASAGNARSSSSPDPVTYLCSLFYGPVEEIPGSVALWIPCVSFLLLGSVVVLAAKDIAQHAVAFLKWASAFTTQATSRSCLLLAVGHCVALYVVASVFLMGCYVPTSAQRQSLALFLEPDVGAKELQILSNAVFALSALLWLGWLLFSYARKRYKLKRVLKDDTKMF